MGVIFFLKTRFLFWWRFNGNQVAAADVERLNTPARPSVHRLVKESTDLEAHRTFGFDAVAAANPHANALSAQAKCQRPQKPYCTFAKLSLLTPYSFINIHSFALFILLAGRESIESTFSRQSACMTEL